jgi:hypothetical protein
LVTLGHANITSYVEFTQRLMDRFERKDPEIHFRELAQLRQTSTPETFITEFQRMVVKVTDISEQRLVMLFTEGLVEPLKGWVKDFRPPTLQDAIMKTQDMEDTMARKAPVNPFIPQKGQETKFPLEDMDRERPARQRHSERAKKEETMLQLQRSMGAQSPMYGKGKGPLY